MRLLAAATLAILAALGMLFASAAICETLGRIFDNAAISAALDRPLAKRASLSRENPTFQFTKSRVFRGLSLRW